MLSRAWSSGFLAAAFLMLEIVLPSLSGEIAVQGMALTGQTAAMRDGVETVEDPTRDVRSLEKRLRSTVTRRPENAERRRRLRSRAFAVQKTKQME